jgi:hypothetical protein
MKLNKHSFVCFTPYPPQGWAKIDYKNLKHGRIKQTNF